MRDGTKQWESLEQWSPTVYYLAGAVLVVYVGLLGYQAFVDPAVNFHDNEAGIVGPVGFAIGFIGLLGRYPSLSSESPKLARLGAVVATVAFGGWIVIALSGLASQVGVDVPTAIQALGFLGMLGMLVGYTAFGVATLWTGTGPRSLGLLLLAPPALFVLLIAENATTGGTATGAVLVSSALCLAHLGLGYVLQDRGIPPEDTEFEPPIDPAP